MKRRRRSEEDDSSLELLLDTMCNTFGGVMFIAISIFVIISGMTQIEQQETEVEVVDTVALQQQLSSLNRHLKELEIQMQNKLRELESRKAVDITDQLKKIQYLMQLSKELEAQQKIIHTANQAVDEALQQSHKALQDSTNQAQQLEQKIKKLEQENLNLYSQLNKLKNSKIASRRMVFKVIETSNIPPYFIIIDKNHAYPVGPDDPTSQSFHPASIVRNVGDNVRQRFECTINPGHGIQIMDGNNLSADFRNFLNSIPQNRNPKFFIYSNSTETVHKMREILKKEQRIHGLSISPQIEPLYIFYTNKTEYEY